MSVSEEECKRYSDSKVTITWGGRLASNSIASGCYHLDPSGLNYVFYNTDESSTTNCSSGQQCVCHPPGKTTDFIINKH